MDPQEIEEVRALAALQVNTILDALDPLGLVYFAVWGHVCEHMILNGQYDRVEKENDRMETLFTMALMVEAGKRLKMGPKLMGHIERLQNEFCRLD